jgi:hypothetical protein
MTSIVLTSKTCAFCLNVLFMDVMFLAEERMLVISLNIAAFERFNEEERRALRGTVS